MESITLMPKGLLAAILKTYVQEDRSKADKDLNELHDGIVKYLGDNRAIMANDGILVFVNLEKKKKAWFNFWE